MEILNRLDAPVRKPTSVALGCFDGIHRGHMQVLGCALEGRERGLLPTVFTFLMQEEHPAKEVPILLSEEAKQDVFKELGFSACYCVPFEAVRKLSPEAFVEEVLHRTLRACRVCCGFNYRFGFQGAGDAALLRALCEERGIEVSVLPPVLEEGSPVSSTRIREAIEEGDIPLANRLLGRPFTIDFSVETGNKLGRLMGTPTINQPFPPRFVLPRFGVYASAVEIAGRRYHGVTNVGVKPTVGASRPLAETWIADFSGDLYGKRVPVRLLAFLRPEKKFDSIEQLRAQILSDGARAKKVAESDS